MDAQYIFFRACEKKYQSKDLSFEDRIILKAFLSTLAYSSLSYLYNTHEEEAYVSEHDIDWDEVLDENFIRDHFNIKA
jgi:hypothetical protein